MSQNANKIIDRLKEELTIKTNKELCEMLNIKSNTLSTWKKRETLDFNKVIGLCESKNLDLNYIFFNEREGILEQNIVEPRLEKKRVQNMHPASDTPEVHVVKEIQLINTNRNIALFSSVKSHHPLLKGKKIVVGQKIKKTQITKGTLYIIKFNSDVIIIDELMEVPTTKNHKAYKLQNYHPSTTAINADTDIKQVWQYLNVIEEIGMN